MAKLSKETTEKVMEFPVAIDRSSDLEGYAANFVSIVEWHDGPRCSKLCLAGTAPALTRDICSLAA